VAKSRQVPFMNESNEARGREPLAVSLIVATVGRTQDLNRLLESIAAQSMTSLELIIVDQNVDDRVKNLLENSAHSFLCMHVRSPKGLSRARNVGINLASGHILCFPDDDCWYPGDLLRQVVQWFDQYQDYDFLCCAAQDGSGREVASRWPNHSLTIDRDSVLRACASASLFMRRTALDEIGGFDEGMGLGASTPFQSAEDSDLALRCMGRGGKGWFAKQLHVYHPDKGAGEAGNSRALGYGMGFGYLLRKHRYSARTLIYHVARALGGLIKSIILAEPDKTGFYWNSACGRLRGYLMPMFDKNVAR
jgi:glycosyltransferase involved in cell wall biosynthesis